MADKVNKIAKRIMKAAGFNRSISPDVLKHCEDEMNRHANNFEWPASVWSHDGSSYDGYISFTEGDAHCDFIIDGWDLFEIKGCEKKAEEMVGYCKHDFVYDNSKLFDDREVPGHGKLSDLDTEGKVILLDDEQNCPDDIRDMYDEYEDEWFAEDYGYCCVEVQFRLKASGEGDSWNVLVCSYVADENRRGKQFIYENEFDFADGEDPRPRITEELNKAFQL